MAVSTKKSAAKKPAAKKETPAKQEAVKQEAVPVAYTEEQVQKMISEAAAKAAKEAYAQAMKEAEAKAPQIITIAENAPKVTFYWLAPVADDCITDFGENGLFGKITGKTGMVYVPHNEFSRFLDPTIRWYIDNRWLIYLSGLDAQEVEQLGVDYKDGEIIDRNAFKAVLDMGDDLLEVYPHLCQSYKDMVACTFIDAYQKGDPRVDRDLVEKLNRISKEQDGEKKGAFASIIEDMALTMMD